MLAHRPIVGSVSSPATLAPPTSPGSSVVTRTVSSLIYVGVLAALLWSCPLVPR